MLRQRRLLGVAGGEDQAALGVGRGNRGRQGTIDGAQLTGQRQLADELVVGQGLAVDLTAGGQDAECDRQVEAATLLGQVGRGQIDGDAARRVIKLRAEDGRAHPVA